MEEDLEAAAEGENGNEALIIDKNYRPDVMIMNIRYAYYEWNLSSG